MNEDINILKSMLQYYRNKCAQLEFDFVLYKIQTELEREDGHIQDSTNARKETDSDAKTNS